MGAQANLALLNNTSYYAFTKALGIDAHVNPRAVTISRILQYVRRGRIRSVHSVQNGRAEVIEADALETSSLVGTPLRDLQLANGIRIGALYRGNTVIVPDGDTIIRARDRIIIFVTADRVKEVEQMVRVSVDFF